MSLEKHRTASNQIPWEWDQEKRVDTKSQKSSKERKVLALSKSPFPKQHSRFFSNIQIAVFFHVNTILAQWCHTSPIAGPDKTQEYIQQSVYWPNQHKYVDICQTHFSDPFLSSRLTYLDCQPDIFTWPPHNLLKLTLCSKPSVDLQPSIHSFTPPSKSVSHFSHFKTQKSWGFPGGPGAKAQRTQDRGPRFDPGRGTGSCMPQLKIPHTTKPHKATKTQDSQINKILNIYIKTHTHTEPPAAYVTKLEIIPCDLTNTVIHPLNSLSREPSFFCLNWTHAHVAQSLIGVQFCDPTDYSPPGSSVHGILQTRALEWVAFPPPGGLPSPGIKSMYLLSPALAGGFFTSSATWEAPDSVEIPLTHPSPLHLWTEAIAS